MSWYLECLRTSLLSLLLSYCRENDLRNASVVKVVISAFESRGEGAGEVYKLKPVVLAWFYACALPPFIEGGYHGDDSSLTCHLSKLNHFLPNFGIIDPIGTISVYVKIVFVGSHSCELVGSVLLKRPVNTRVSSVRYFQRNVALCDTSVVPLWRRIVVKSIHKEQRVSIQSEVGWSRSVLGIYLFNSVGQV